MICLQCGYCCKTAFVIIVDKPELGLIDTNLILAPNPCKHLGFKDGLYSCAVHDEPWYKKTPCAAHGQIERKVNTPCRMGEYLLLKE